MTRENIEQEAQQHYDNRMSDLRELWQDYTNGIEDNSELGSLYEYGLSFDYVAPGTFKDDKRGYWRYQLSWGGPADEFRFYGELVSEYGAAIDRVEYAFLDWFTGHVINPNGTDRRFLIELFESFFVESGTAHKVREYAMADYEPEYEDEETED